jgi:hypothetical protein
MQTAVAWYRIVALYQTAVLGKQEGKGAQSSYAKLQGMPLVDKHAAHQRIHPLSAGIFAKKNRGRAGDGSVGNSGVGAQATALLSQRVTSLRPSIPPAIGPSLRLSVRGLAPWH